MAKEFPLVATEVEPISTKYRRVAGLIPNEQTISRIKSLRSVEPRSMQGQPPIIWDRAEGFNVFDAYDNMWLDFSSGVLVTNAGHGRSQIVDAVIAQASKPLLTTYCFPNQPRIELTQKLISLAPPNLSRVFLLSTGAEGTECALKLMRTYGTKVGGNNKKVIVSFDNSFYGRTMGAQQMGGGAAGKAWIKNLDPDIVHIPFPDGFRSEDTNFDLFEKTLSNLKVTPDDVAGVITETYQGGGPYFMPKQYAQRLRKWCDKHNALLCFDEVQAGFGRCGRWWGFELYDVSPDLFCIGKGLSSSLPISAVIGRHDVMDLYGPNEMTSTHSGNPLSCAAALANIKILEEENLLENAAALGIILQQKLQTIKDSFPDVVGFAPSTGLVGGLQIVKKATTEPDPDLAWDIVNLCFRSGLLMFAPVGLGSGCVKIAPPLCITKDALIEGCNVITQCIRKLVTA